MVFKDRYGVLKLMAEQNLIQAQVVSSLNEKIKTSIGYLCEIVKKIFLTKNFYVVSYQVCEPYDVLYELFWENLFPERGKPSFPLDVISH